MIKEPLYRSVVSLKFNDAWDKVIELSKGYTTKSKSRAKGTIVLDASYSIRMLTYSTWAEGITMLLKSINNRKTIVEIYGEVLLSPHHIFRTITINNKSIDKDDFLSNVKSIFSKYEAKIPSNTSAVITSGKAISFWVLEFVSIISFLLTAIRVFVFDTQIHDPVVLVALSIFFISQSILIVWFTRKCYNNIKLSARAKSRWVTCICVTGFVGCYLYYLKNSEKNGVASW